LDPIQILSKKSRMTLKSFIRKQSKKINLKDADLVELERYKKEIIRRQKIYKKNLNDMVKNKQHHLLKNLIETSMYKKINEGLTRDHLDTLMVHNQNSESKIEKKDILFDKYNQDDNKVFFSEIENSYSKFILPKTYDNNTPHSNTKNLGNSNKTIGESSEENKRDTGKLRPHSPQSKFRALPGSFSPERQLLKFNRNANKARLQENTGESNSLGQVSETEGCGVETERENQLHFNKVIGTSEMITDTNQTFDSPKGKYETARHLGRKTLQVIDNFYSTLITEKSQIITARNKNDKIGKEIKLKIDFFKNNF